MQKRKIEFDYNTVLNSEASPHGSPERNMLMSLLERAILDYVGNNAREAESAKSWIFEEESQNNQQNQTFTFNWICAALDLDPRFVRKTISAMPKRGKNKVAPWYFDKSYTENLR